MKTSSMYPGQPWMARRDWAEGRINPSTQTGTLLFIGIMFCAIGGVSTFFVLRDELPKHNYPALLVLLFPAAGLGLLAAACYSNSAARRFGKCSFEMTAIPGAIGGTIEGVIRTARRVDLLQKGIRINLSCVRIVTSGAGKHRSTKTIPIWSEEKVLRGDMADPALGGGIIPVFFRLPADQPESTGVGDGADGIHWQLEARAAIPGTDFHVKFDVPVYNIPIPPDADMTDPTVPLQIPVEELRLYENSPILVNESPVGSEFYFPAFRNISAAIGAVLLCAVLAAIAATLIFFHIPLIFGILTGGFALLLLLLGTPLWMRSDRVTIDSRGVRTETILLLYHKTRNIAANDVTCFRTSVGLTTNTHRYHDIQLVKCTGVSINIALAIADKAEADWLVEKMKKALGQKMV